MNLKVGDLVAMTDAGNFWFMEVIDLKPSNIWLLSKYVQVQFLINTFKPNTVGLIEDVRVGRLKQCNAEILHQDPLLKT